MFGKSPMPQVDETSPRYRGWRVVLVCFVMALFAWGLGFYGHGVYLAELQRLYGWPAGVISGGTTLYYLVSGTLIIFISDAIRRIGPRRLVVGGTLCLACAAALIGQVTAPWQVYAVYLLMAFGWAAMSGGAINNIIGLWFNQRRGLAISLALSGASVGGMVMVPALIAGIAAAGFATAMAVVALTMAAVLLPIVIIWVDWPPAGRREQSSTHPDAAAPPAWTRAKALGSLAFWTVSAPFALALIAQVGFLVHQVAFLEPMIGRAQAGLAVALTSGMSVLGRLGLGAIIDRLNPRNAAAASLLSQTAALAVMTQTTDAFLLFAASAVFGASVGNLITFPALIVQREFDAASFGLLISLSIGVGQFTFGLGPGLLGVLRDATGNYTASIVTCIACEIAAIAIVLMPRLSGIRRAI